MPELMVVLVIILILALLWRGPKTLPSLGAALGRGIKEARREASELTSDNPPPAEADKTEPRA
jgi:Sec-independent protein translocase protein TatA